VNIGTRYIFVDALTAFGLFAVSAMLVCYALEDRSRWWTLAFGFSCVLGSIYGFLQGASPFGAVEGVWSVVAFRRWRRRQAADSKI
jgi:4-amino-4-deoxy-L-arabinose transferase-like glycosyltransferase